MKLAMARYSIVSLAAWTAIRCVDVVSGFGIAVVNECDGDCVGATTLAPPVEVFPEITRIDYVDPMKDGTCPEQIVEWRRGSGLEAGSSCECLLWFVWGGDGGGRRGERLRCGSRCWVVLRV